MAHVPHLYVPPPWPNGDLTLPPQSRHHLERVVRRSRGAPVTYTDGAGCIGDGVLGEGVIVRGVESVRAVPPPLRMAVAPLQRTERARFVVEKLAELGVGRLVWLRTRFTQGSAPRADKAAAWATSALEQSGGAHRMEISGPTAWEGLVDGTRLVVAARDGAPTAEALHGAGPVTVVIGPEGGLAPDEIPAGAGRWDLGERILRTETAAVVAAALVLDGRRRGW